MTGGPTVVKLGGSVITEKDRPETLDGESLDRSADSIAAALDGVGAGAADGATGGGGEIDGDDAAPGADVDGLVIVHGGGSFGHYNASEYGVDTSSGTHDPVAIDTIHGAMTTLNRFVLDRLLERGVPAVPVHPFSTAFRGSDGDVRLPTGQVATMLGEGFVPVLHGDLVSHAGEGATVVSGDELVTELSGTLSADRIGLCSTVPGVLDADETVIDRIDSFETVEAVLGGSDATDVTGGMAAKVRALLEIEPAASIFGIDDLADFLAGAKPGTTIE